MLDHYIVRFILYFPKIVIFLGLYSLVYIRPPLVLVIHIYKIQRLKSFFMVSEQVL